MKTLYVLAVFLWAGTAIGVERPPQAPELVFSWTVTEQVPRGAVVFAPRVGEIVTEAVVPAVTTTERRGPFGRVREKTTTVAPAVIQTRTPVIMMQSHQAGSCGSPMQGRPAFAPTQRTVFRGSRGG